MQESKTINAAINRQGGMVVTKNCLEGCLVESYSTSCCSISACLWTSEIKMDRLKKLEDAISRENEEDISNLEEYFTKLLTKKQNHRQLDESAILDKILNMRKDEATLSLLPEDQFNLIADKERFHVPREDVKLVLTIYKF